MAEKLLKPKAKRRIAPGGMRSVASAAVAASSSPSAITLVGTYKDKQLAWIRRHGLYNYPVRGEVVGRAGSPLPAGAADGDLSAFGAKVGELWLYADAKGRRHALEVTDFVGVQTRAEFLAANPTYPKAKAAHAERYLVFRTKPLDYGPRLDGSLVVARAVDFTSSRTAKIAKAIAQYERDGRFAPLEAYLPADLARVPHSQLRVCEAAVQLDFFLTLGEPARPNVPFPPIDNPSFTFIDLFAGVGGFRLAMQAYGGKCVFSSEWNESAQKTYCANYGDVPYGDITKREVKELIPAHFDVLCAGFPCQPFSLAGVSARNSLNQLSGFQHPTQGTLFFDIVQIVHEHKPKVIFLENVRNLMAHDEGRTFDIIKRSIEAEGYSFNSMVIDASPLVPQKRLRCYMVCVHDNGEFEFPIITGPAKKLKNILEKNPGAEYTISDNLWAGHQRRTRRNLARGTGFTAFTADVEKPAHTLVARYYKDGKECLIPQEGRNPRLLTPRECARLQGFPEEFVLPQSRSAAYKQMGNSVAVPVLKRIAECIYNQVLRED